MKAQTETIIIIDSYVNYVRDKTNVKLVPTEQSFK